MPDRVRVYLETGRKRVFASAADWPGWSRGAKDEASALSALAAYAPRYAPVAKLAGESLPAGDPGLKVIERIPGSATTDFGAPGVPAKAEARAVTPDARKRASSLLEACWEYFDNVYADAPAILRKGPRGGGRDRDKIFEHVLGAESEYGRAIGLRQKSPPISDAPAVKAFRRAIVDAMERAAPGQRWPVLYFARRAAWHVLDHAWEIEDRIP